MTFPLLSLIAMTGSVSSFEEKDRIIVILISFGVQVLYVATRWEDVAIRSAIETRHRKLQAV